MASHNVLNDKLNNAIQLQPDEGKKSTEIQPKIKISSQMQPKVAKGLGNEELK